jgi:glyoxylase-like metal-dependent hydrolase (beta-lactamase superfamily II)
MDTGFENDFIPPMTTITSGLGQEVIQDLYCLPIQIVNICMVGNRNEANHWVLVDAGMPNAAERIIRASDQRFGKENRPKAIILTHGHFDHVGAIVELIARWEVPVYAHELELPYLTGQADYPPGDPTVGGGLVSKISPLFPNHRINLGHWVRKLPADGSVPGMLGWRWVHTPGHTPGHISLFHDEQRALIAGDAFVTVKQESLYKVLMQDQEISGPPAYFTTDWQASWASVRKLAALQPAFAITGHGLPMSGERLVRELETLARNFDKIAIPQHGRYVN